MACIKHSKARKETVICKLEGRRQLGAQAPSRRVASRTPLPAAARQGGPPPKARDAWRGKVPRRSRACRPGHYARHVVFAQLVDMRAARYGATPRDSVRIVCAREEKPPQS